MIEITEKTLFIVLAFKGPAGLFLPYMEMSNDTEIFYDLIFFLIQLFLRNVTEKFV